ncbi:hypothetical protein TNCV_324421 [Trichonephila clavipes]|nr:hypothetical protein TNCV_324421 [Trichonephila clavipes]
MDDPICYEMRVISIATDTSVRCSTARIRSLPSRAIFLQYNARPHVAKTVRDFCSAQNVQLFPWPAYSLDMSPIEHVWDLVDRRVLQLQKKEILLRL